MKRLSLLSLLLAISLSSHAATTLKTVYCPHVTVTGDSSQSCNVVLTAVTHTNAVVPLKSSDSAVAAPASVTVKAGHTTVSFTVTFKAVAVSHSATLTGSYNGTAKAFTFKLTGVAVEHGVSLTWKAPAVTTDVVGYHVYRSTSFGYGYVGTSDITSYKDTNVTTGATYTYVVRSIDATGIESTDSNSITVTIP